jgi:WxcM-like, C-terminal.
MKISNLKKIKFNRYPEKSGELIPFYIDDLKKINFKLVRFFFLFGKKKYIRADHAHKKCKQIIIPIKGKIKVTTYKKGKKKVFLLNRIKKEGLYIPTFTWIKINFYKNDDCLLTLCSYKYDKKEYINSFKIFKEKYFKK